MKFDISVIFFVAVNQLIRIITSNRDPKQPDNVVVYLYDSKESLQLVLFRNDHGYFLPLLIVINPINNP